MLKNSSSFDLIIPEEVEAKIRHLCTMVHDVEWSGVLFYTVEGSLDDGTFKATCVDICVMDIGTGGFTNFKDTPDIIDYRITHGLLKPGVYEGLIHSHNNMSAFFSGTDTNTLLKEGSDLNHFLSLIVCNAGQYVARITRKLRRKIKAEYHITYTESLDYNTFEDVNIVIDKDIQKHDTKVEEKTDTCIEYFEMNINKAEVEEPFQEINERLAEIKRSKYKTASSSNFGSFPRYDTPYQVCTPYKESPIILTKEIEDPNQTSLDFDGHEEDEIESAPISPSTETEVEETTETNETIEFYQFEQVPFNITRTLCLQLVTSNILVTSKVPVNIDLWVRNMDSRYESRFGSLEDSFNRCRLQNWIQNLIDEIIGYSVDKKYEDKIAKRYNLGEDYDYNDNDSFIHLYACDMIEYLDKLPESVVKSIMIEELKKLMPKEYDNLRDS